MKNKRYGFAWSVEKKLPQNPDYYKLEYLWLKELLTRYFSYLDCRQKYPDAGFDCAIRQIETKLRKVVGLCEK